MKKWRTTGVAASLVVLFVAVFAGAATKNNTVRIRVLDSETQSVSSANEVPRNCDAVNFDAYCHSGRTTVVTNTLLVQEGDGTPFRIVCTVESKWSRCLPLAKDQIYTARREKRGFVVLYPDESGKTKSQLYTFVNAPSATTANAPQAAPAPSTKPAEDAGPSGEITTGSKAATVKCSFSSTPAGAEVTVDGRYVGSTPSVVGLATGSHVVVIRMTGFADWKRQLEVSAESELTVNAVLQKGK
jgi:hypothetical protein